MLGDASDIPTARCAMVPVAANTNPTAVRRNVDSSTLSPPKSANGAWLPTLTPGVIAIVVKAGPMT